MSYFLYILNPPRITFMADMTPVERQLMREHSLYWVSLMDKGSVIAFGPVADPKGAYGICIMRVDERGIAEALGADDPVIRAKAGFSFELYPMPNVVYPK